MSATRSGAKMLMSSQPLLGSPLGCFSYQKTRSKFFLTDHSGSNISSMRVKQMFTDPTHARVTFFAGGWETKRQKLGQKIWVPSARPTGNGMRGRKGTTD